MMVLETIFLFIGEAFRYVKAHQRGFYVIGSIVLVLFIAVFFHSCFVNHEINKTQNEITNTRIEEANKDAVSKTAASQADQKTRQAQNASNASKTAIDKAHEARNANVKDASADELHKAHCDAYPEDCK